MWFYKDEFLTTIPKDAVGFIYLITRTNLDEDCSSPFLYIGKKSFYKKTKSANKESDWQKYYSSSKYLKEEIKRHGIDNFTREIIRICYSKSEMTWHEVMEQINRKVLRVNKFSICKKIYYNLNISGKFFKDKFFTNADKNRIKEYIQSSDCIYERIAITDGVKTKYINLLVDDIDEWLIENKEWYVGTTIHDNNSNKKAVTNDIDMKYIDKNKIEEFLNNNKDWKLGRLKFKDVFYCVTDGTSNLFIKSYNLNTFLDSNNDWYKGSKNKGLMKCVNNGLNVKRIHFAQVDDFLLENQDWEMGNIKPGRTIYVSLINLSTFSQGIFPEENVNEMINNGWEYSNNRQISHFFKWVTKNNIDKKVNPTEAEKLINDGWGYGRSYSPSRDKICISKNNNTKYIYNNEIDEYIIQGWEIGNYHLRKSLSERGKIYICNDISKEQKLLSVNEVDIFLQNNLGWRKGQFKRENFTTENKVFAIDMNTGKKITVSVDEYKNNDILTSIKAYKVKVKKKNRIVFVGYLPKFFKEFDVPESIFKKAIRENNPNIIVKKGKNKYLTDEKWHIVKI